MCSRSFQGSTKWRLFRVAERHRHVAMATLICTGWYGPLCPSSRSSRCASSRSRRSSATRISCSVSWGCCCRSCSIASSSSGSALNHSLPAPVRRWAKRRTRAPLPRPLRRPRLHRHRHGRSRCRRVRPASNDPRRKPRHAGRKARARSALRSLRRPPIRDRRGELKTEAGCDLDGCAGRLCSVRLVPPHEQIENPDIRAGEPFASDGARSDEPASAVRGRPEATARARQRGP